MAKWTSEADTGFLQTLEIGTTAQPRDLPQVGAVFEKSLGDGLADRIKQAADKAASMAGHSGAGNTLRVDELGASSGLRVADSRLGLDEDRLDKARQYIKESKFSEALNLLIGVLRDRPGFTTALYLKGLCELRLDEAETALNTIAPVIRSIPLSLDSQVRQLRAEIREKMMPEVVAEAFALSLIGLEDTCLQRLNGLLDLDPDVPVYHFLRIHVLLNGGHLTQASASVDQANPYCEGSDRETLSSIKQEILRRMFEAALEPARSAYRDMNWRKGRKELERIRAEWGDQALWKVFYSYLESLGGALLYRGRLPAQVIPQGDPGTVDRLHFILIREELAAAKMQLNRAKPDNARQTLLEVIGLTPHFPYLRYLLGQATYLTTIQSLTSGKRPELADVEVELEEALENAQFGARDPEITAAGQLVETIQLARQAIVEIRAEQEKEKQDLDQIRPFGERFVSVMESAKSGIQSVEQFRQIQKQLQTIRADISGVERRMRTEQGHSAVKQFGLVLDGNLQQLANMEPEMRIAEQISGFQKKLKQVLSAGPDVSGLANMDRGLAGLKGELDAFKHANKLENDALKAVQDLNNAIDGFRGDVAEAILVNPFVKKFEGVFGSLQNRTTPFTYSEARTMKSVMSSTATEGRQLLPKLQRAESRKNVQKIIDIAEDVVRKIPI